MLRRVLAGLMLPAALLIAASAQAEPTFRSERIEVEVRGQGQDVVLIPGLSSSPEVWEATVEAMPGYRYHLVQVAGFAGAAAGANAEGPVVAPVATEIARYIAEAGLDRPALVGHSLGGFWAMMVAARHPDAVGRVMVVDMLPFLGMLYGPPGTTAESVAPTAAQVRDRLSSLSGADRKAQIEAAIATMVKTESLRAGPIAHSLASDPTVTGQAMYDLITTDLRRELPAIQGPLTVLWVRPPQIPLTDEQMGGIYAMSYATAPQAVVRHVPDSLHFIMLDAPERFQAELKEFLEKQ